ncbi:MAG: sugar transferase [Planctomycetota bacterium]
MQTATATAAVPQAPPEQDEQRALHEDRVLRFAPAPELPVRKVNLRLDEVLPADDFRRAVHRRRARVDRLGGCFGLLYLRIEPSTNKRFAKAARLRMGRALLRAARGGDLVGWHDDRTAVALLMDCDHEGARKLADRSCAALRRFGIDVSTHVLSYGDDVDGQPADCDTDGRLEKMIRHRTPMWKRAIDIAAAGGALLVAGPVMVLVALGIKFTSPGPIFFLQKRSGLGGVPFKIYKFRTMVVDAEAQKAALRAISEQDGPAFKLTHDPRITKFGRFLRVTSLDELPQLFNILKGDMSLVGPRPLPVDEQAGCSRWQAARLDVAPGLTCIWQVEGRSRVSFDEWMRMDLRYLRRRTPLRDVRIILSTIPAVLLRRGSK